MLKALFCASMTALLLTASVALAAAPSCSLVPGWKQAGDARSYTADTLFEYMDGNAEGYLIYGFVAMQGVTCEKTGVTLVIDSSDFGDPDLAYGMFTSNRDMRLPSAKIGAGGQIAPRRGMFAKGNFFVELSANPEGDHTKALEEWTAALEKGVEGASAPPAAFSWFPSEKQQSLRLVPESVLGIRLLQRGYAAIYDYGKSVLVLEASQESANTVMQKLRARFGENTAAKIADDAFLANDRYLGRMCFFRKGRYIGGYANVAEGQDPATLASAFAARIP